MLVLGGTGFIGRWVVEKALKRHYEVTVLSINRTISNFRIGGVNYICIDILDECLLKNALGKIQFNYVINLSGYIDHSELKQNGKKILETHFNGLINLISCLNWDELLNFIQVGSSDEYGNITAPQKENDLSLPISCYSMAKLAANQFLQMLYRSEGFPATILRFFLVYGPGQDENRFLPHIINCALRDKNFPVSEGKQKRDFCYIEDVVEGIFDALESHKCYGQIINIASGSPERISDVIERVLNIIGKGTPEYGAVDYRPGENMELYADISKAQRMLNWRPKTLLEDGLSKTISFYRNNI